MLRKIVLREPTEEEKKMYALDERRPRRPIQEVIETFYKSGKRVVIVEGYEDPEIYPNVGSFKAAIAVLGLTGVVHVAIRECQIVLQRIADGPPLPPTAIELRINERINQPRTCDRCGRKGTAQTVALHVSPRRGRLPEAFCFNAFECELRQDAKAMEIPDPRNRPGPKTPDQEEDWRFDETDG